MLAEIPSAAFGISTGTLFRISGRTNTSYQTTTGLRYEITDLLYANVSIDFDYETHPVNVVTNEDIALFVGRGAKF